MSKKQPPYLTDDLNGAVTRLQALTGLQDKLEQAIRLNGQKMTEDQRQAAERRFNDYSRDIHSTQERLHKMHTALDTWETVQK